MENFELEKSIMHVEWELRRAAEAMISSYTNTDGDPSASWAALLEIVMISIISTGKDSITTGILSEQYYVTYAARLRSCTSP